MKRFIVIRTTFDYLESVLNRIETDYTGYRVVQIVPEHSYKRALANIVLQLKEEE